MASGTLTARERRLLAALRFIEACPEIHARRGPDYVVDAMAEVARETVRRETRDASLLRAVDSEPTRA